MRKPSNSGTAFDMENSSKVEELLQAEPGSEPAPLADPSLQADVTERRSPHRVISTASYYHPERRGPVFGDGTDEFPEGLDAGDGIDGTCGDGSFS